MPKLPHAAPSAQPSFPSSSCQRITKKDGRMKKMGESAYNTSLDIERIKISQFLLVQHFLH